MWYPLARRKRKLWMSGGIWFNSQNSRRLEFCRGLEFGRNSRPVVCNFSTVLYLRICSKRRIGWRSRKSFRCARMGKSKGAERSALNAAKQTEVAAAMHRETAEQKRQRIAELEERARLFGDSVKQSTQAKVLERKWLRFLLVYGDEYGFDKRNGPTVELRSLTC